MKQAKTKIPTATQLSSVALKIAVVDNTGTIISTNTAWDEWTRKKGGNGICAIGLGGNYLSYCNTTTSHSDLHPSKIAQGIAGVIAREQDEFYMEYPCNLKDEEHWFAMTVRPLGYEKTHTSVIQEDITEKKLFRQYINSITQENAASHIQSPSKGLFELDLRDNTTSWSDEHYRIFGLEPQSVAITHEKFLSFVHPAYIGRINNTMQQLIRDKKEVDLVYGIVLENGAIKYIHENAKARIDTNGKVTAIYGSVRDVTENIGKEMSIKDETLHHSHTAIATSDLEGNISYANPAFLKLWGFKDDNEILGRSNKELSSSAEKIAEIMNAVISTGKWTGKDTAKKKDGTPFNIYLTANLVKDQSGQPLCVTATFIDITEQEKAKQLLLENEAKATILFEYSPIIIWEEDFSKVKSFFNTLKDNGVSNYRKYFDAHPETVQQLSRLIRVTQVNQRSLDFYGVNSLEELGTSLPDWFLEETWDVFKEELIALAEGQWQFDADIQVKTPSGDIKHLSMRLAVPPQYITTLEVVLVSFVDITALKEKERQVKEYTALLEQKVAERTKALRFSEAKLAEAHKLAKIGHWSFDDLKDGLKWSEGMYEIYGFDKDIPVSDELLLEKVQFDDPKEIAERINAIYRGERVEDLEFRIIDAKGEEKYIRSINRAPLENAPGEKKTQFGVIQDITQHKIVENQLLSAFQKEQELNDLKSRFVSMASHEFRTPLTAIVSSIDLLRRYIKLGNEDKQEKHIQRIKGSVRNLITILNDFLSLEKMETGKVRIHPQEIAIASFIQDILMEVRPWVKEEQKILFDHTGEAVAKVDPHMTRNVLLNLLSNALKYSEPGTTVYLNTSCKDGNMVIRVKDEGIGIPEKDQKNMFTRFYRASNASAISGTGLGLTIIQRYLELMGGSISFTSAEGEGSTFEVVIPAAAS